MKETHVTLPSGYNKCGHLTALYLILRALFEVALFEAPGKDNEMIFKMAIH